MKKYYWLVAGAFVGVFSVVMGYINFNLLVQNDVISLFGTAAIIAEYTALIFVLSLGQKLLNK